MNNDLFYQHKLQEQVDMLNAELDALRLTVKEQYNALKDISKVKVHFTSNDGEYHYIFRHVKEQLDDVFQTAIDRIGG